LTEPSGDSIREPSPSPEAGTVPASPPAGGQPVDAGRPVAAVDLGRRGFFRAFAGELFQTAATVAGAAQALQRASAEAASAILDPASAGGLLGAAVEPSTGAPEPPRGFRTPFREDDGILFLIDQRRLPDALVEYPCRSAGEVAFAIREMIIRGAPAIGQAAAIGMALTAEKMRGSKPYARRATLRGSANALNNSRPTAVNLRWAVDRMMARYAEIGDLSDDGDAIADALRAEADAIVFEATTDHGRMAGFGLEVLPMPDARPVQVLTHCNTGPLAAGQFGTALGIIQAAHHADRPVHVWVDETRPYLQGARLTAWELAQAGVAHTLIPDVAAGHLMARGEVDVVLVGADRVAANGDTANKIGTYPLAVLAARHGIPFYVVAPTSSVDLDTPDGTRIPIEERKAEEVLEFRGVRVAPLGTEVRNPAFDVTPAELISGIVTEEGVIRAPFDEGLRDAVAAGRVRWGRTGPSSGTAATGPDGAAPVAPATARAHADSDAAAPADATPADPGPSGGPATEAD
jgi:methylthioribose-1-phosphate isomerase